MACKPRQIIGNEPFSAIPKDYNRYGDKIIGNAGTIFLAAETVAFMARVIADGGTVEDIIFLDSFVKDAKANDYYNDIVFAGSPSWGVKGTSNASTLYSVPSAAADLTQTTGAKQPAITLSDLSGRTRLSADGVSHTMNSAALVLPQPHTNVFMGYESESWTDNDHLCSGVNAGSGVIFQFTATPDLYQFSGIVSSANSDATLTTPVHLRALFSGAASETQVDANAAVVSNAGAATTGGIYLFSDHNQAKNIHASLGAYVVFDSALNPAKIAAIKAFSAAAYGTA
ncbi:MAG: hypothetical protein KAJ19_02865 [Gammaproteobacteria bacterium]|nr:hypothetical protein [Gammaproteobacteria bacterium]